MSAPTPDRAGEPVPRGSFARYWTAATISSFGTAVTAVAMPVLVVQLLEASALEVGIVNAAQFLPYAVLGLIAGAYTDRWRRKPILVWASIGRAVSLGAVPVLWVTGALEVWMLVLLLLAFGAFSVFGFAATQSFLPRLVPRSRLVVANARLDQTDAAAQTLGPALGGGLVGLLGAPLALAVDAISYLVDALLNASIRVTEPRITGRDRSLGAEIREGLRWAYRHRTLGPLALSTHVWFVANGVALTALSLLALRSLGLTAFSFGVLLAVSGTAGLVGTTFAARVSAWLGTGRAIVLARATYPLAWLLIAASAWSAAGPLLLYIGMAIHGLAGGVENANEMGYRQSVTPDGLLGRVNANIRSANRTGAALGALLGGAAVGLIGDTPTLVGAVVLFAAAALIAGLSPLRRSEPSD
ncbi:MFS transporter [Microbacterium timonense]|uniref:MFS transporter n=1 Tax=Microbacterium timonense TaxID=2086576 RepID=UPI001F1EAEC7|nr:MFS transporter [Microbacterium timonense]